MTSAKIIADSISEAGIRIITLELEFLRFLLAQFNTHRMFSRSAQSSRAVPVEKMIEGIKKDSFIPIFMKNESGMQSTEFIEGFDLTRCNEYWRQAKEQCLYFARGLKNAGVHKQFVNRLLEPFSTVKVVVTATEWDNFFKLRLHHAAQPEMKKLAQAMKTAMDESHPEILINGEWHLPYVDSFNEFTDSKSYKSHIEKCSLISVARCARVSYLNHDNSNPDIEKDLELARQLLADGHLSPFEHQAKPMINDVIQWRNGVTHASKNGEQWSNNFRGWIQHRALLSC